MSDAAFLYHCLEDGRWHGQAEILAKSMAERGHGMTVHSRAADLRKKGCVVECELRHNGHGRALSYYRMVVALDEPEVAIVGSGLASGSSSVPANGTGAEPSTVHPPPVDADTLTLLGIPIQRRGAYGDAA